MIIISELGYRWYKQAKADLDAAKNSLKTQNYEWSCFQAQQAAEKGIKSFLYKNGYTSILTHSLKELIREAKKIESEFSTKESEAKSLDLYYIPTRYPNGLAGNLAPFEFYEEEDAKKCLNYAESILQIVKKFMER
ncbi:MAG: HEPN domain-containing protein [Promethearchaeia archaeon]